VVLTDGTLSGNAYAVSDETQNETYPWLALDGPSTGSGQASGGALVVWERDNVDDNGYDLYGRRLGTDGQPVGDPYLILQADDDQQRPVAAGDGDGRCLLAWQDNRNGNWDVYGSLYESWVAKVIIYTCDPLNRLTEADYSTPSTDSGQAGERYEYTYDEVGNRILLAPQEVVCR
jgi:hypothetical protein